MKRLVLVALLGVFSSACVHRWVGRPVAQLEKEYGRPRSIQSQGENRIYIYPDDLAGRGEMTFTVDRKGIIRAWCATADVPGPTFDDVSIGDAPGNGALGGLGTGTVGNSPNTTNGGPVVNRGVRTVGPAGPAGPNASCR